ncbi:uncharacterized protein CIMG_12823 [Coccidioides immitis RS]|uniref:Uncharacterized protein n=1 Tax=Coccidioides immitis (strain RS) TaxID=246410 RepID=A0A0D8JSD3_COCIM|nr:uncharacterized protein CIMG_12823 [Coccidioides immitis RS]KJF60250.1 hypothetical protein CIMG_12823 [Coccidioides immitis RS]
MAEDLSISPEPTKQQLAIKGAPFEPTGLETLRLTYFEACSQKGKEKNLQSLSSSGVTSYKTEHAVIWSGSTAHAGLVTARSDAHPLVRGNGDSFKINTWGIEYMAILLCRSPGVAASSASPLPYPQPQPGPPTFPGLLHVRSITGCCSRTRTQKKHKAGKDKSMYL